MRVNFPDAGDEVKISPYGFTRNDFTHVAVPAAPAGCKLDLGPSTSNNVFKNNAGLALDCDLGRTTGSSSQSTGATTTVERRSQAPQALSQHISQHISHDFLSSIPQHVPSLNTSHTISEHIFPSTSHTISILSEHISSEHISHDFHQHIAAHRSLHPLLASAPCISHDFWSSNGSRSRGNRVRRVEKTCGERRERRLESSSEMSGWLAMAGGLFVPLRRRLFQVLLQIPGARLAGNIHGQLQFLAILIDGPLGFLCSRGQLAAVRELGGALAVFPFAGTDFILGYRRDVPKSRAFQIDT